MELQSMGERVFAAECIQKKRIRKVRRRNLALHRLITRYPGHWSYIYYAVPRFDALKHESLIDS